MAVWEEIVFWDDVFCELESGERREGQEGHCDWWLGLSLYVSETYGTDGEGNLLKLLN